jgi:phosphorylcholine metabolism protein LicD
MEGEDMVEKSDSTIQMRISSDAKEQLITKANEAGMNLTEYILTCCRRNKIYILPEGDMIVKQLRKLRISCEDKDALEQINKSVDKILLKFDSVLEAIASDDFEITPDIDSENTGDEIWFDEEVTDNDYEVY